MENPRPHDPHQSLETRFPGGTSGLRRGTFVMALGVLGLTGALVGLLPIRWSGKERPYDREVVLAGSAALVVLGYVQRRGLI